MYDWAGQTRADGPNGPFQGQKQTYVLSPRGDVMRYAPYAQLDQRLDAIGVQLQQENTLRAASARRSLRAEPPTTSTSTTTPMPSARATAAPFRP